MYNLILLQSLKCSYGPSRSHEHHEQLSLASAAWILMQATCRRVFKPLPYSSLPVQVARLRCGLGAAEAERRKSTGVTSKCIRKGKKLGFSILPSCCGHSVVVVFFRSTTIYFIILFKFWPQLGSSFCQVAHVLDSNAITSSPKLPSQINSFYS